MTEIAVVGSANLDLVVEVDTIPLVGKPSSGATCVGSPAARVPTRPSQLRASDATLR